MLIPALHTVLPLPLSPLRLLLRLPLRVERLGRSVRPPLEPFASSALRALSRSSKAASEVSASALSSASSVRLVLTLFILEAPDFVDEVSEVADRERKKENTEDCGRAVACSLVGVSTGELPSFGAAGVFDFSNLTP